MGDDSKVYKEKANAAFKAQKWDDAIHYYTKAINVDPENHLHYSNRAASYLKTGEYEKALEDANICISLKRDYHKGYGRKGSAYHSMKKYNYAIAAYKEGLKICKDDPILKKGLAAAKAAKTEGSNAKKSYDKSQASNNASRKRRDKAQKAKTVSSFIEQTRRELKMQMAAIQAQLDLIDELAGMSEEEKMDLLFSLIDADGDGTVDSDELAAALRKRNGELSFMDSMERAVDMVKHFDMDRDGRLDPDEFSNFIEAMVQELDIEFNEFAEFLVLQILFKDSKEDGKDSVGQSEANSVFSRAKEKEDLSAMISDKRMRELFKLFDRDGSRELLFWDVATSLYPVTLEMDEAVQKAMGLLLMMDKDDKRRLDYDGFARLIMAIVAAADSSFDNVADDLMIAVTRNDSISPEDLETIVVSKESKRIAREMAKESNIKISALQYARLQKLFDLWDIDGDGGIQPAELNKGLQKFQNASGVNANAKKEALALSLNFDMDGNNELDRREFAAAMAHYAKAYQVELHDLIDFMCVATLLGDNVTGFQAAYGEALKITKIPDLTQELDDIDGDE